MKKTKIIATIGPVTYDENQIIAMYEAGVNIIRFNFSHADHEGSKIIADRIHSLNAKGKTNLSLLLDTKGPEIRTGDLKEKITYKKGDIFEVFVDDSLRTGNGLFCDYPYLINDVEIGGIIAIDSGLFDVKVVEKKSNSLLVEALNDAVIGSRRHINLPGVKLRLPGVTPKDREDIIFAIQNKYNFIAASFIRSRENVKDIKKLLSEYNASHIKIISKIENLEGVENMEEIALESDGIMVARGDLGIEVPIEKLGIYQRQIMQTCAKYGKISVIATHLLETMIDNPTPTRAESSDVFNSALAKPDCLMLSGETTIGKFPIKTVETMTKIIKEAEIYNEYNYSDYIDNSLSKRNSEKKILLKHAIMVAEEIEAKTVIVFTKTGLLARLIGAFKPSKNIYAFTPSNNTAYFINILFGVKAVVLDNWNQENYNENLKNALEILKKSAHLKTGDSLVAVNDIQKGGKEYPVMEIITINE